jgi:hypothetical protein
MILMDQLLILVFFFSAIGIGVHATHDELLVLVLSLEFLVVVFL